MANKNYNKQVTPKGYKMGGRVKKMGGGMMKRPMYQDGTKPKKDSKKDPKKETVKKSMKQGLKDAVKKLSSIGKKANLKN